MEAARGAALEEGTGAREASLKVLQEKASPGHSVSIVAPACTSNRLGLEQTKCSPNKLLLGHKNAWAPLF